MQQGQTCKIWQIKNLQKSLGTSQKAYVYYATLYCGKLKEITDSYICDTFSLVKQFVDGYEMYKY